MGAPWLEGRGPQLFIFRLGELEVLGSSGALGLAVRFNGCGGSWEPRKSVSEASKEDPSLLWDRQDSGRK